MKKKTKDDVTDRRGFIKTALGLGVCVVGAVVVSKAGLAMAEKSPPVKDTGEILVFIQRLYESMNDRPWMEMVRIKYCEVATPPEVDSPMVKVYIDGLPDWTLEMTLHDKGFHLDKYRRDSPRMDALIDTIVFVKELSRSPVIVAKSISDLELEDIRPYKIWRVESASNGPEYIHPAEVEGPFGVINAKIEDNKHLIIYFAEVNIPKA